MLVRPAIKFCSAATGLMKYPPVSPPAAVPTPLHLYCLFILLCRTASFSPQKIFRFSSCLQYFSSEEFFHWKNFCPCAAPGCTMGFLLCATALLCALALFCAIALLCTIALLCARLRETSLNHGILLMKLRLHTSMAAHWLKQPMLHLGSLQDWSFQWSWQPPALLHHHGQPMALCHTSASVLSPLYGLFLLPLCCHSDPFHLVPRASPHQLKAGCFW